MSIRDRMPASPRVSDTTRLQSTEYSNTPPARPVWGKPEDIENENWIEV